MRKTFIPIIILFCFNQALFGQIYQFTLTLKDIDSGDPIFNQEVFVDETSKGKMSGITDDKYGVVLLTPFYNIGSYPIRIVSEEYELLSSEKITVTKIEDQNQRIVYLKKKVKLIFYGTVKDKSNGIEIENANVSLRIAGGVYGNTETDASGSYRMEVKREEKISNEAFLRVESSNYLTQEKPITIEPEGNKRLYKNDFLLEPLDKHSIKAPTINVNAHKIVVIACGGLALGLETWGLTKFFANAKPLHKDYFDNENENDFLALRPEFENREAGYQKAEKLRRTSKGFIIGGGIMLLPALYSGIRLLVHKKAQNQDKYSLKAGYRNGQNTMGLVINF